MAVRSRHAVVAFVSLAALAVAGRVAADPPAPDPTEAVRRELQQAYRSAASVRRAYEVLLDGVVKARWEVYRNGETLALRVERAEGLPPRMRVYETVTDGADVVRLADAEPRRHRASLGRAVQREAAFREAVVALAQMYAVERAPDLRFEFHLDLALPRAPEQGEAVQPGTVGMRCGLAWGADSVPEWLSEGSLTSRADGGTSDSDAVPVRIDGYDATVHRSDGWIASAEGTKPGTDSKWVLREQPATLSPQAWETRLHELLGASGAPIVDDLREDQSALFSILPSLDALLRAPDFPRSRLASYAAMDVLFTCAWGDAAITREWSEDVRNARASVPPAAVHPEARALREERERKARSDLVDVVHRRLFALPPFWDGVLALQPPFTDVAREWIARRIDVLWSDLENSGR